MNDRKLLFEKARIFLLIKLLNNCFITNPLQMQLLYYSAEIAQKLFFPPSLTLAILQNENLATQPLNNTLCNYASREISTHLYARSNSSLREKKKSSPFQPVITRSGTSGLAPRFLASRMRIFAYAKEFFFPCAPRAGGL